MHKLVNVLRVSELEPGQAVERELALITVAAPPGSERSCSRSRRCSTCGSPTSGRTRSSSRSSATSEELDAFEELVRPYGIKELARTGRIGLARASSVAARDGNHSSTARRKGHRNVATIHRTRQRRPALRQGRRGRLRQPGARARAQPARLGRRRRGRPAAGQRLVARRGGGRADGRARSPRRCGTRRLVSLLLPDQVQPSVYEEDVAPNLSDGRRARLRARVQRPLRPDRRRRRPRRDHGRAEGARATSSGASSPRGSARRPWSPSRRTRAARRSSSRSPTARPSAPAARA